MYFLVPVPRCRLRPSTTTLDPKGREKRSPGAAVLFRGSWTAMLCKEHARICLDQAGPLEVTRSSYENLFDFRVL